MKKKVFFILSSLRAGGSERVFWLLSQHFDKSKFEITLVLLDMNQPFFSTELEGIRIVDLKSIRSSRSFWKLYRLLRTEKPDVVYSTASQVNILVASIGLFNPSIRLIGREYCIPDELGKYISIKGRFVTFLIKSLYRKFDFVVCQSEEMRSSLAHKYHLNQKKLVVIPNPILPTSLLSQAGQTSPVKRLIIVGRLVKEKGHERLLQVFKMLPLNYRLTIVGNGPLRKELESMAADLNLRDRIEFTGQVHDVTRRIAEHDLLVLTSYTEGFPNVVIEALSVGTPVVCFKVGGTSEVIIDGFNGYIVAQDDLETFRKKIIVACGRTWNADNLKQDAVNRFGIQNVVGRYAALIHQTEPAL